MAAESAAVDADDDVRVVGAGPQVALRLLRCRPGAQAAELRRQLHLRRQRARLQDEPARQESQFVRQLS